MTWAEYEAEAVGRIAELTARLAVAVAVAAESVRVQHSAMDRLEAMASAAENKGGDR